VLASTLMLFAVISLGMGTALDVATRELTRTSIHESLELTARVAEMALGQAVATAPIAHTAPAVVHEGVTPEGIGYEVSTRFLDTVERADADSVSDWHFLLTVVARSRSGAEVVEQLQLRIPAPPPVDAGLCHDPGCPVPALCGPPACDPPLRMAAEPVAWHLPETP
jgi:hypothetical protein